MEPFNRRYNEPPRRHGCPYNKERVERFSSSASGYHARSGWKKNSEWRDERNMPYNGKSIARGAQNSYLPNRSFGHRPRNPQYRHTGNSTAHKTSNTYPYKRKWRYGDKTDAIGQSNSLPIQDENTLDPRSTIENQRDASSNNKRRRIDHTNNDIVTNRQDISLKNKTNLHIDDNKVASNRQQYSLSSNNQVMDTFNTPEKITSIPETTSKTSRENRAKEESKNKKEECKKYEISKKCDAPSVSKLTEANRVGVALKSSNKNTKRVSDQNDTSSLKTDNIKQFKILLCEISFKMKEDWKLDVSGSALENIRSGEINFIKKTRNKKLYSLYEVKYISTTSSKDAKLNYKNFSRSDIKRYFQRYLSFCNNRPSDYLDEFEVRCNIQFHTSTFEKQGINIVYLGSDTYKLEIRESYKKDMEKLGLYQKFLSCCTLPKLADLIIDCMKKKKAHFNTLLFRKYYFTFIKEKILEKKEEKDKYIMKFHQDFIRGNNLSESANELRRLFLSKNMKLTNGMWFTVSNVKFKQYEEGPVEPLLVEKPDMFHNFLKIFRFRIVGSNIDALVRKTIGEKFIAIDNDWYLNAVQEGLHKIMGLGNLNSRLFQFLERKIHKCNIIKRLQEESCFQQENIKLENIGLTQAYQYLTEKNKKVVFCLTKHITVTEHRLRQLSNQKFGYLENQESLFINDKVMFEMTEDIKQGFLSYSLKLLVILLQEKSTVNDVQRLNILNDLISQLFLHGDKSVIIVLNTRYEKWLRDNHPNIPVVIVDKTLSPLMPESLNQLKQSNVVVNEHEMKIAELMDDVAIAELMKLPEILEQVLDKKLVFENVLIKPNGFDQKCYETKLRDESDKICKVIDILKCDSQIVIISGESGIGKSVCLYELAQKTCSEYVSALECGAHFWLIQMNINKLPFKKLIAQDTTDLLKSLVCYLDLNNIQKKVFIMTAEGKLKLKLILFIDGYDELPLAYKNFALVLLDQLKTSSIKKIFIASRDNAVLNSASGVSRYTITFSTENQKQYCCKYFNRSADYIDSLAKELTSTPLHLKMLHKINNNREQDVPINDLLDLYKKYVEMKINMDHIYTFFKFSAQRVLSKEDFRLINFDFQEENMSLPFPEDLQHVAFYEYFTAWWLSAKFISELDIRRNILIIVDRFVDKTSPVFLSTFLAPLTLDELVDEIAQHGCLNFLKVLLSFKDIKKPNLHRVVEKNNTNAYEVLKYLFEHYKRTNDCELVEYVNEQMNDETPIQVTSRLQKMDLACELMLVGADISCLERNFLDNMTIYVIRELIGDNFGYESIAEKLLELSSETLFTHLSKELEYPKLMKYLLQRGRKTMIERLLMEEPNRKKLLTMRIDEKSPLELVYNSQWLDSGKRLEMCKYIIENAGDELERENKFFIEPILRGACETTCEKIFNYFIDCYPGNVNGFSNAALRDDRLSDVEFVVKIKKRKRTIDEDGNTLLHRAIKFGASDDITDFLITREGLKEVNRNKETALHVAFKTGQKFPRIKYLIEQGASLQATDKYGLYPWCYALLDKYRRYGDNELTELMDYLLNYKKIEPPRNASVSSKSDAYNKEVMRKFEYFRKTTGKTPIPTRTHTGGIDIDERVVDQ